MTTVYSTKLATIYICKNKHQIQQIVYSYKGLTHHEKAHTLAVKKSCLKSKSFETQKALISIVGLKRVTGWVIELPTYVETIDPTQRIATIIKKNQCNSFVFCFQINRDIK
ncbi:hypothetical protein O6H91_01G078700 [Diphasiastrum complanatum]|uniref:Uncharacterized protein n=1 Tax=Diphasiastrum complanatum TaxID=34168 RepID=A0ACC2ESN9_DIPCM|nr:hypothetical protein O6H91_01G078700 [Diphasiastrum complanatum]